MHHCISLHTEQLQCYTTRASCGDFAYFVVVVVVLHIYFSVTGQRQTLHIGYCSNKINYFVQMKQIIKDTKL